MKKYKLKSPVRFHGGEILALTPDLVEGRESRLEEVSKGVFRVTGEIVFKAGTELGVDTIPKAVSRHFGPLDGEKPEPRVNYRKELETLKGQSSQELEALAKTADELRGLLSRETDRAERLEEELGQAKEDLAQAEQDFDDISADLQNALKRIEELEEPAKPAKPAQGKKAAK